MTFLLKTQALSKARPLASALLWGPRFTFPVACLAASPDVLWHFTLMSNNLSQPFPINSSSARSWSYQWHHPALSTPFVGPSTKQKHGAPSSKFRRSPQAKASSQFPWRCPHPALARLLDLSFQVSRIYPSLPTSITALALSQELWNWCSSFLPSETQSWFSRHFFSEILGISPLPIKSHPNFLTRYLNLPLPILFWPDLLGAFLYKYWAPAKPNSLPFI